VRVNIDGEQARVRVSATENGDIHAELFDQIDISPMKEKPPDDLTPNLMESELSGITTENDKVKFNNTIISTKDVIGGGDEHQQFLNEIHSVQQITIDGTDGYVSRDESVTISFDVSCFKPFKPVSVSNDVELIQKGAWKAVASPIDDIGERIEVIKQYKVPVRTAEIRITQKTPGTIDHQVEKARGKLENILELCSFVQGTGPTFFRASLDEIGGEPVESASDNLRFLRLYNTSGSIGGAFKQGELVWGRSLTNYLDESYDNYSLDTRDNLRLRNVLGYYTDSMNSTVAIQGRFLCVCSAIELLARRYSDLYEHNSGTRERIEYMVNKLDVETEDLRSFAGTSEKSKSQDYFYKHSRNYLTHGDGKPNKNDLLRDFSAASVLLQRIIRNQLVGTVDADEYPRLGELTPIKYTNYD
jgi:hypothetical protein